jgi:nucleotide-binding universal stress UspA family protein
MKTILAPLDGTPLAEQALPYVQQLASMLGARVLLLRAAADGEQARWLAGQRGQPGTLALDVAPPVCALCSITAQCLHADCYLADQAEILRAHGVEAYGDTVVGTPAAAIAERAAAWPDTLIAMATHAQSGLRRWVRGSLADKVLHETDIPLLLVRDGTHPAPERIARVLVPLDGSAFAAQALPLAVEVAARAGAALTLVWVVASSIDTYMDAFPAASDPRQAFREQATRAYAASAGATPGAPAPIDTVLALGPTAEAIAEEARRLHADLIVMATHGYTGLRRWRLGSVADTLLRLTAAPLLLVRGRDGPRPC